MAFEANASGSDLDADDNANRRHIHDAVEVVGSLVAIPITSEQSHMPCSGLQ